MRSQPLYGGICSASFILWGSVCRRALSSVLEYDQGCYWGAASPTLETPKQGAVYTECSRLSRAAPVLLGVVVGCS